MKKNILSFAIIGILVLVFIFSCKKDQEEWIPNVYVNFSIPIETGADFQYRDLKVVGGWVYVTGGYKGIIIYRKSMDEFMAFDRACSFDPRAECSKLEVESSGIIAIDSCCGSRFILSDGSVLKGPATRPLKAYRTTFENGYLYVYN